MACAASEWKYLLFKFCVNFNKHSTCNLRLFGGVLKLWGAVHWDRKCKRKFVLTFLSVSLILSLFNFSRAFFNLFSSSSANNLQSYIILSPKNPLFSQISPTKIAWKITTQPWTPIFHSYLSSFSAPAIDVHAWT